ncbi:MAG: hypothetical protein K8T89_11725, partial [Planctomycetes bacterium]|nr:hypothetical protein [Planctomycetota bacterium]
MSAGTSDRLVPRWVHVWAILTVIVTACLLVLGGLVTTFRVGMADPVWPTTPWFLFSTSWTEPRPGFLIEHAHRLAGFSVGGLTAILVLGLWWTEPRAWSRWLGLLALIGLLANFGQFHRLLMEQVRAAEIVVPQTAVLGMLVSFLIVIVAA